MVNHLILPTHISFPSSTNTCPLAAMTSPTSLNTRTLCSHHRRQLPLLNDVSESLLITPTSPSLRHSNKKEAVVQPSTDSSATFTIMQPPTSSHDATLPLLLNLSRTPPTTPTPPLLNCSDASASTLQPSQHPNMPRVVLRFNVPIQDSVGMVTAREWRREQLMAARKRWDQINARRIQEGHLPMTYHSHTLRDSATSATDLLNTVTDTPPQSPSSHDHENHPEDQMLPPRHPDAWSTLTSIVKRPSCWQTSLPPQLGKTTKIPLRFRRPTLPKGWRYEEEVAEAEVEVVKEEEGDPFHFQLTNAQPRSRSSSSKSPGAIRHSKGREMHRHPYTKTSHSRCRDSTTTGEPSISPSTSSTNTGAKYQRATSKYT